jgi:uncharacterized protein
VAEPTANPVAVGRDTNDDAGPTSGPDGVARRVERAQRRSRSLRWHRWSRTVHVYTSMVCLLVTLFFAVTGITLNHPDWTFGGGSNRTSAEGVLPDTWRADDSIDWLRVAEYLRKEHALRGEVTDTRGDGTGGSLSFRGPGYGADITFDGEGAYLLNVEAQGPLAVLNDLHKGRDSRSSWRWLIDVAGGLLVVISLTGLILQFFLRKRRRSALSSAIAGAGVLVVLGWLALR